MTTNQEQGLDGRVIIDLYMRLRRTGSQMVLVALVVLVLSALVFAAVRQPPPEIDSSKLGIHLLLDDGRSDWPVDVWPDHMAYAAQVAAPNGIAVQVIRVDDLDPMRWQIFMDLAAEQQLTPVLRLATTFDRSNGWWEAPQPDEMGRYTQWGQRYADFVNAMDWPSAEKHLILLNEPNNGVEWSGAPDPTAYAQFVVDVAAVLREEVPDLVLLNAAFDLYAPNTGEQPFPETNLRSMDANSYMDAMVSAQPDIFTLFDIWNNHSYPMGAFREHPRVQSYGFDFMNGAQDTTLAPPEGVFNRGINGYEWELWKLEQFGITDLPVMITETGWRHTEATDVDSLDAGDGYPTATTVAQYLDLALRGARSPNSNGLVTWTPWLTDERVVAVAPFALNGVPNEWSHTNWLQLDAEGNILGTYAHFDLVANRVLSPR